MYELLFEKTAIFFAYWHLPAMKKSLYFKSICFSGSAIVEVQKE
jgi:hypothetical protein